MRKIKLRAVGDNLMHRQLCLAAKKDDGSYDFRGIYDHVKPLIEEADIAVINQETILVEDPEKVSYFPSFGTPTAIGDAIADAGFDVVLHASNHALDKGYEGICDSVAYWESRKDKAIFTGIHTSRKDQDTLRIIERQGIRVAILNYTSPLNFHLIPPTHPYCVDVMKPCTRGRIKKQIKEAKEKADLVIVFPHWGCEYLYEPVASQKKWARFFANCGAALIIGTHPHVLENTTVVTAADGRRVPCLYSLGNFISCQFLQGTMLGGMADVDIVKDDAGTRVEHVSIIPLVTHTDTEYSAFAVYPLADYTDELAEANRIAEVIGGKVQRQIDVAYLKQLYKDIRSRQAMKDSMYKTPLDVYKQDAVGVYHALVKKGKS